MRRGWFPLLFLLLSPLPLAAEDGRELPTLAPVTVIGTLANPATGRSVMDRETIERLPAGRGSINELLAVFPDVQVGEAFRSGGRAGEILPPPVSIAGGQIFQNNFLLDRVGNNSLLDPGSHLPAVPDDVPGHPQELFLSPTLVERITLYDSNVPARYGGFTGGVVVVETRDPAPRFGGTLDYRTTRDSWSRFHLQEGESAPRFEIQEGGASLDLPLPAGMGLLGSVRRLTSDIPERHLGGSETQTRRKDDLFLKYAWDLPSGPLRLTFVSTPYAAELFLADVANSNYRLRGGGSRVQADYVHLLPAGELRLWAAFQYGENSREAPAHLRQWATSDSRPWGSLAGSAVSYEGGFGDIEKTQQSFSAGAALPLASFRSGRFSHLPEWGMEIATIRGTFTREEDTHVYLGAHFEAGVVCGDDDFACIDEEQYFTFRKIYPRQSASARINLADLYLDDQLRSGRLALRPGVRLSYDDFMDNLNLAPRLAAAWDFFKDGRTVMIAGLNRYYGRNLLTFKLREAQLPVRSETRGTQGGIVQPWQEASFQGTSATRFSRLETPYADELTTGVDQALFDGRLTLKYVQRQGRDEFVRSYGDRQADGLRYYTLTNDGRSRHESWRLTWERSWARHFLSLNLTWQESTGNSDDYNLIVSGEEIDDRVWFQGRIVRTSELPRRDFNRTWTANLTYIGEFPWGFAFSNVARYRSGYRALVLTREQREVTGSADARRDPLTGEFIFDALPVYEEKDRGGGIVFDCRLAWQPPPFPALRLQLEIENVFNSRLETGTSEREFELGRRFWAGAEYRF